MKGYITKRFLFTMICMIIVFAVAGCGSGGGGNDGVEDNEGGGNGTGADGVTTFWLNYGTAGMFNSVQQASDGGFVGAGGQAPVIGDPTDVYIVKTDASGTVVWEKSFGDDSDERANAIQQTADGGYVVAGVGNRIFGIDTGNFYLLKLDANGTPEAGWPKAYPGNSLDGAYAVRETKNGLNADGYVFVGSNSDLKTVLVRTDLSGVELWRKAYVTAEAGWDAGSDVEQTSDGGFVIAGVNGGTAPVGSDALLIRTDENGDLLPGYPKNLGPGMAYSVRETPDGFILTGTTTPFVFNGAIGDLFVIKTDPDGNVLWRKTFGGSDHDEGRSVDLTGDGGYIVTGRTRSFSNTGQPDFLRDDVYLIKLTSGGNTVFQKVKGRRDLNSEGGSAVKAVTGCGAADCGYVIAGGGGAKPLLMKTDKNGDTVTLGDLDVTISVPAVIGTINFDNAFQAVKAVKTAMSLPVIAGEFMTDRLVDVLKGTEPSSQCDNSGSASYTLTAGPLAANHVFTVNFDHCISGPAGPSQLEFDGTYTLTVDEVLGDPASADFTLGVTIQPISLTITDDVGDTRILDSLRFRRVSTAGTFAQTTNNVSPSTPLTLSAGGTTRQLTEFSLSSTRTAANTFTWGNAGEKVMLTSTDIMEGGTLAELTLTIHSPVGGTVTTEPVSGEITITAADGSRSHLTVNNGIVLMEIDTDGNGTTDGTVSGNWDDL